MFGKSFSTAWSNSTKAAKESVLKIVDESIERIEKVTNDINSRAITVKNSVTQKTEQFIDFTEKTSKIIAQKAKKAFDKAVKVFSNVAGFVFVKCPIAIKNFLIGEGIDKKWDGKFLPNCDFCQDIDSDKCGASVKGSLNSPPKEGKRSSSNCKKGKKETVYFINGIRNTIEDNCKTAKEIAKATCDEVVSMYNRTQGVPMDLYECIQNIKGTKNVVPTDSMVNLLENHFSNNGSEKITLFAHSQGGLITQQALIDFKNTLRLKNPPQTEFEIEKTMSRINVKSFGTAIEGWPKGPNYEQFTNNLDPVPKAIILGQVTLGSKTNDLAEIPKENAHYFTKYELNPHGMSNVYIKELKKVENERKASNGKLFGCCKN